MSFSRVLKQSGMPISLRSSQSFGTLAGSTCLALALALHKDALYY